MMASILPLNRWLLVITAALVAALAALEGGGIEARPVEPLFPAFDGALAVSVELTSPVDEVHPAVTARRTEAGEPWALEQLFGASASPVILDGFLARVGAMTNLDLVSEDPGRIDEYELGEDVATRVVIRGAAAAPEEGLEGPPPAEVTMVDFYVATASASAAFVRRAGEAQVFRIPSFRVPPTRPFTWFGRRALVPYENVQMRRVVADGPALGGERVLIQTMERFGSFRSGSGADVPGERARDTLQRLRALFPLSVDGERGTDDFPAEGADLRVTVERVTGGDLQLEFFEDRSGESPRWLARRSTDRLILECDPTVTGGLVEALRGLPE